jgi:nitrous oxidase accessory protein NosD
MCFGGAGRGAPSRLEITVIGFRCRTARVHRLLLGVVTAAVVTLASGGAALASDHGRHGDGRHQHGGAVFVSPSGTAGSDDRSCDSAAYSTIQSAVNAAPSGGTVVVCPGTYTEDVVISEPLTLTGVRGATIQGAPTDTIMCDQLGPAGPGSAPCLAAVTIKSSSVKVSGFTVTGAIGEGILATGSLAGGSISDVSITGNRVVGNDTGGAQSPNSAYPQCNPAGPVPGDCGEGIHLMGVYDSVVTGNYDSGNSGGVLLTDEFGPTHDNLIAKNVIKDNLFDCGVTVPGHNPFALDANGDRQPSVAGDYNNVIAGNVITGNGVKGEGAGVIFANASAGSASYDNLVIHNYIAGNGLGGVTLHAHPIAPGTFEDLNGNNVIGNVIGQNNLAPDTDPGPNAPKSTVGVLVYGAVPVSIKIVGNRIFDNSIGIWLGTGGNIAATLRHNRFFRVGTPVFIQP